MVNEKTKECLDAECFKTGEGGVESLQEGCEGCGMLLFCASQSRNNSNMLPQVCKNLEKH